MNWHKQSIVTVTHTLIHSSMIREGRDTKQKAPQGPVQGFPRMQDFQCYNQQSPGQMGQVGHPMARLISS